MSNKGEAMIPIFISAGDPSGDIAGSNLIRSLQLREKNIKFLGLGGKAMRELGQEQIVGPDKLAVLGFWEVALKYLFFRKLMLETVSLIEKEKPKAIILIDYPGFNLRLAERIKRLHIPIIYYISPQIWAWGEGRIKQIAKLVDMMLLILPFEKDIYDKAGVKNQFVGHYLLDDIDCKYIKAPYDINSHQIALLPGSRPQEVERMMAVLIKTADILHRDKKWRFVVAGVKGKIDYSKYLAGTDAPIEIVKGRTRDIIASSRLVITSSGTATLEIGIIGRPMVVIYKTGWITYMLARCLVKLDKIALINITAGKKIVPELIQAKATPENIAGEAQRILNDHELSQQIVRELSIASDLLGPPGASQKAAEIIRGYVNC